MAHVLNTDRIFLHTHEDFLPTRAQIRQILNALKRRKNFTPIAQITRSSSFFGMDFFVDENVLIPRPETEILALKTARIIRDNAFSTALEIGVGSGALSICVALLCPHVRITAIDVSDLTLSVAKKNIQIFDEKLAVDPKISEFFDENPDFPREFSPLSRRISLVHADFLDFFDTPRFFDVIFSNPPYVAKNFPLPEDVRKEPEIALFGGDRGDEILQKIIFFAQNSCKFLACEFGVNQQKILQKSLNFSGFSANFYRDFAQHWRVFVAKNQNFIKM